MPGRLKQAEDIELSSPPDTSVVAEFTDEDRIEALKDQSKAALMLAKKKKEFLTRFETLHTTILSVSKEADKKIRCGSNIYYQMNLFIPKTLGFKKDNNEDLSRRIIGLSRPCEELLQFIKGKEKTRRSTVQISKTDRDMRALLDELHNLMVNVEVRCQVNLNKKYEIPSQPQLSRSQKILMFNKTRIPVDPTKRKCLFCNHPSIMEPPENDEVEEKNREISRVFTNHQRLWNEHVENQKKGLRCAFPTCKETGVVISKEPKRKPFEEPILMCMCHRIFCTEHGTEPSPLCPTGCMDSTTEARCTLDDATGDCSCPICQCSCNQAIYATKHRETMAAISRGGSSSSTVNKNNNVDDDANITYLPDGQKLQDWMAEAIRYATDGHLQRKQSTSASLKSNKKKKRRQTATERKNEAIENRKIVDDIAKSLVKNDRDKLALGDLKKLKGFGRDTIVALPKKGKMVDTRALGSKDDFRARNNRLDLGGQKNKNTVLPGMVSKLKPDLSGELRPSFLEGTDNYNAIVISPVRATNQQTEERKDNNNNCNSDSSSSVSEISADSEIEMSSSTEYNNNNKQAASGKNNIEKYANDSPVKRAYKRIRIYNAVNYIRPKKETRKMSNNGKILRNIGNRCAEGLIQIEKHYKSRLGIIGIDEENADEISSQELHQMFYNGYLQESEDSDSSVDSDEDKDNNKKKKK